MRGNPLAHSWRDHAWRGAIFLERCFLNSPRHDRLTCSVVGYGDSFFTDSYVDTATGNTVYPNVGATPSSVVAFIVP